MYSNRGDGVFVIDLKDMSPVEFDAMIKELIVAHVLELRNTGITVSDSADEPMS